jgi:hypothetical protein
MPDDPRRPPRSEDSRRDEPRRETRLRDLARRILSDRGEGEREVHLNLESAREALGVILETGDKAKTEVVRLVAREVRHYLEALRLKEDLRDLAKNYSLEVNATFRLKPIAAVPDPAAEEGEGRNRGTETKTKVQAEEPTDEEEFEG